MKSIDIHYHEHALEKNYILILTSNDKEKDALNSILKHKAELRLQMPNRGCTIGTLDKRLIVHLSGASGASKEGSIANAAVRFIEAYSTPRLIILAGICWGDPNFTFIGQTLVCTHILSLNDMEVTPTGTRYRKRSFKSNTVLDEDQLASVPCTTATMASLETLYKSDAARDDLLAQYPEVKAGEMEAFGFVQSVGQVPWVVVKTVSDYGGDSFSDIAQKEIAATTAQRLPIIIDSLCQSNGYSFETVSSAYLHLFDAMIGDTISLHERDVKKIGLNDILNNEYGPLLLRKLRNYCSETEYDAEFPFLICDVLLELSQNAFKHNGSKTLSICLNATSITVMTDNDVFDMNQLTTGRGGAEAWKDFSERYMDNGNISYRAKKNHHRFSLHRVNKNLRRAKENCAATIRPDTIGSGFSAPNGILVFETTCSSVFISTDGILMRSRALSIIEDIKRRLSQGLVIYLCCRNSDEAQRYKSAIGDDTEKLRVFTV
ncbi:5'-methylthioadenosine/S-adenosylhomocysteine nucleosidase family protein [Pseudomonas sp. JBR1]|uniref:5'-methylthioadenosine/S-adenosylhomocysteine nucleosidase family protein n=1 Tax=Pseudomonas sp. JBR1 TaxID=3020907 RepID=UPI002304DF4E|nr:hypothetical protein [Pseudomonas sp. JBR1]WCE10544.1 hypothetical protein PJ259_09990 [Pseudomonas sp. JBR1]